MKNKFLLLSLLFFIIFFSLSTVKASSSVTTPSGRVLPTVLPDDGFTDYIILDSIYGTRLVTFNNSSTYPVVTVNVDGSSINRLVSIFCPGYYRDNENYVCSNEIIANFYNLKDDEWVLDEYNPHLWDEVYTSKFTDTGFAAPNSIIYCSCDLRGSYYNGNFDYTFYSDILFQKAPVPLIPMNLKEVKELKAGATMVVRMILPVCLAIFGILLLVYLIRSKKLLYFS